MKNFRMQSDISRFLSSCSPWHLRSFLSQTKPLNPRFAIKFVKKMGSKRKEEKKSKDEGRSKRPRTDEDEEGRSSKSDRKEKRHKHRSDKEKKKKDKHKDDHKKRERHSKHDFQELSSEDYFLKSNEFATWLKEEKDVFFSDLSSDSSRALFQDFIKAWNNQDLEPRYYEGIVKGPRTAHNWKIKK